MDDFGDRLAALEATLSVEVRALHAMMAQHVQTINGEMFRVREGLKHIDDCLDRRLKELHGAIKDEVRDKVAFPTKFSWLLIAIIVTGVLGGIIAAAFKVGQESQRVITLPTTPPPLRERIDR